MAFFEEIKRQIKEYQKDKKIFYDISSLYWLAENIDGKVILKMIYSKGENKPVRYYDCISGVRVYPQAENLTKFVSRHLIENGGLLKFYAPKCLIDGETYTVPLEFYKNSFGHSFYENKIGLTFVTDKQIKVHLPPESVDAMRGITTLNYQAELPANAGIKIDKVSVKDCVASANYTLRQELKRRDNIQFQSMYC